MKTLSILLLMFSLNLVAAQDSNDTAILTEATNKSVEFYKLKSSQSAFSYKAVKDEIIDAGCEFASDAKQVVLCTVTDSYMANGWNVGLALKYSARNGRNNLFMMEANRIEN